MYDIIYSEPPSADILKTLHAGLSSHALQTLGATSLESFGLTCADEAGDLIAGCTGYRMYGALCIKFMWVKEEFRKKGIGKHLMQKAEEFAREKGCRYINVETFNWQAKDFYEKLSFELTHSYSDYDFDSILYFFRKKI